MKLHPIVPVTVLALALLAAAGCAASGGPLSYANEYRGALERFPGTPHDAPGVARRFAATYAELAAPDLRQRVESLYAPGFYFNDTLTTLRDREALVRYLEATGRRVDAMQVEILGAHAEGADLFLRWYMRLEFRAGWRDAVTETVGMTHLRLDRDGRIVLHQDFWDSAEGIYREVPVIGRFLAAQDAH